jgi:glycosyltransferase involved in cell wall biosynthesis
MDMFEHHPLVSVIVPVHNRGSMIELAVNSVLRQGIQDIEVLIVDDASTDDTRSIVRALEKIDNRVRLIEHDCNKGAQAARNTGIRNASGDWIAFLDSDDEWFENSLHLRLDLATREKADVVYSSCLATYYPDTDLKPYHIHPFSGYIYRELLAHQAPLFQSLLVKKTALEKIGYLDESIISFQEWDTSIMLAKYFKFSFVPQPTFIYHHHQGDTISKSGIKAAQGYEQVFNKYQSEMQKLLPCKDIATHYRMMAKLFQNAGEFSIANRYMRSAIRVHPFGTTLPKVALSFFHQLVARLPFSNRV